MELYISDVGEQKITDADFEVISGPVPQIEVQEFAPRSWRKTWRRFCLVVTTIFVIVGAAVIYLGPHTNRPVPMGGIPVSPVH